MKINSLRFKNLNSLAGEWSIDFTVPEYVSDGIFAISGPTGAGKSTILDAICLALYGCTPRLENISAATNELMSRQTGECFAEVVFETGEGSFRAHWSQRRARGKANGPLQQPKHEISETGTGKILASQLRKTAEVIEEKTGMDFGRFTQSMLLAQGGFAAFLKATGNERAPILEQITGTEIYSQISIHVFQQQKSEKEALERLRAESSGIMLMSTEEEEKTKKELEGKNIIKTALADRIEKMDAAIKWLKKIEDIKAELSQISVQEAALEKEIKEFEPDREKLKNALTAASLDSDHATLKLLREQQITDSRMLQSLREELPALQAEKDNCGTAFTEAENKYNRTKAERELLLKVTGKVKLLDQEIAQKVSSADELATAMKNLENEKNIAADNKAAVEKSIAALGSELEEIKNYQAVNATDATLLTGYTGISSTVERLLDAHLSMMDAADKLSKSKESLKSKSAEEEKAAVNMKALIDSNKADKETIEASQKVISELLQGKSLEEVTKRKDGLIIHLAGLKQIGDYDSARKELRDGEPCPLCGSLHHPFADGNIPSSGEAEQELGKLITLLEKYGRIAKDLEKLVAAERVSGEKAASEKTIHALATQQKQELEKSVKDQTAEFEKRRSGFERIAEGLKRTLLPIGIIEIPSDNNEIGKMLDALKNRRDSWKKNEDRKGEINTLLQAKKPEIAVSDTIISAKNKEITAKKGEAEALGKALNAIRLKRSELFGEKVADDEERLATENLSASETAKQNAANILRHKEQQLAGSKARISDLEESMGKREKAIGKRQKEFIILLKGNGFETEDAFLLARLTQEEKVKLEEKSRDFERHRTEINTSGKTKSAELEREQAKNLTREKADYLATGHKGALAEQEVLLKEVVMLTGKLASNDEAKARGQEVARRIAAQASVCERWSRLSSLIGSADGKKYRNFAQGLTLEIMVSYANSQLSRLSDRYLLIRDKDEPLDLNVVDNYQAGEIRSTKNLSGGESFIVSLALALGLSHMSSRNVRIDSLFLDEGFGTLDEETLETALGTLASLRQDGKMIGVISHVGAMKERINTKIIVQPIREGRSVLSGPGCVRIP